MPEERAEYDRGGNRLTQFATFLLFFPLAAMGMAAFGTAGGMVGFLVIPAYLAAIHGGDTPDGG